MIMLQTSSDLNFRTFCCNSPCSYSYCLNSTIEIPLFMFLRFRPHCNHPLFNKRVEASFTHRLFQNIVWFHFCQSIGKVEFRSDKGDISDLSFPVGFPDPLPINFLLFLSGHRILRKRIEQTLRVGENMNR